MIVPIICAILAVYILSLSVRAFFNKKQPVRFWARSNVKSGEIRDVIRYNRANGRMWLVYGACFALSGALAFIKLWLSVVALSVSCLIGAPVLVVSYYRIYEKFRRQVKQRE